MESEERENKSMCYYINGGLTSPMLEWTVDRRDMRLSMSLTILSFSAMKSDTLKRAVSAWVLVAVSRRDTSGTEEHILSDYRRLLGDY